MENSFICIEVFTKNKEENNTIEIISSISTESKNNINNINDILSNFSLDNFFKGEYEITNQTSEIKDTIIKKINNEAILNGQIDFSNIINGQNNNLVMEDNNIIYEITTSNNNNSYNNISTINLGNCENILKNIYNINKSLPLIIFKVEYSIKGLKIPVIGYEVFHPENNSQLNLSYCKNETNNLSIPVTINEDKIYTYDPNSDYYTDDCSPYTTDNGTDILIYDRKNEYINNNMSLCENNCEYYGYDPTTKKVVCKCEFKTEQIVISEVDNDSNLLSNNFTNNSSSNTVVMKCYYTLFSVDGISNNYECYILIFIIILYIILAILFYKCGYPLLISDIREIIGIKEENEKNINVNETIDKKNKQNHKNHEILIFIYKNGK